MESTVHSPPQAREQGLLCREMPDGMMVYDTDRHQAHSLNRSAALVWQHCDGQRSVAELTALLQQELDLPPDEAVVRLALDRLEKAHLLKERLSRPEGGEGYTRRGVMRKLGMVGAAGLMLPVVESLVAPAPASAASGASDGCVSRQGDCSDSSQCCRDLQCRVKKNGKGTLKCRHETDE